MKPTHARDDPCCTAPGSANSCLDTDNLLTVQQSTRYNLDMVVAPPNSSRKARPSPTIGRGSAVLTEDMSPAPAAGTYRRSAGTLHDQRQVTRSKLARSSETGAGSVWSGSGVPGLAAACLGITGGAIWASSVCAEISGLGAVCGTDNSGVWVLEGSDRTKNSLPENLDDVGVIWERGSGYETAWATPGHDCLCSYAHGHRAVLPQANPPVFTEAGNFWSRVASLLTPWCAKGEVPTGLNLNRFAGDGSYIPWHCDNERLFWHLDEPKVIVSMSLGHSVLIKWRRRASQNTPSEIRLDHFDLLVMDGLTL